VSLDYELLVIELRQLRKGRGVLALDIKTRLGTELRRMCGVVAEDDAPAARRKVVLRLNEFSTGLPEDLRLALVVTLALHPDRRERYLSEREAWLAEHSGRDVRTVRRRANDAITMLVSLIDSHGSADVRDRQDADDFAPDGWYVERFRVVLRLNGEAPEALEERRIVARREGLDEVVVGLGLPREPSAGVGLSHAVVPRMLYGGDLVRSEQPSHTYFRHHIALPGPLSMGDHHDFAMQLTLPPGQPMSPQYVYLPLRRCDYFELRVCFDPSNLPRRIWRVVGKPHRVVDDFSDQSDVILPDRLGEVFVDFREPRQGLGYGIQWEPSKNACVARQYLLS